MSFGPKNLSTFPNASWEKRKILFRGRSQKAEGILQLFSKSQKKGKKKSFLQYFTVWIHTKKQGKIFCALFACLYSLGACPCQVWRHCSDLLEKNRPKKLILTLHTHPEKGYRFNLNSLMGYFGLVWVTLQYALPILDENCNSRASHPRNDDGWSRENSKTDCKMLICSSEQILSISYQMGIDHWAPYWDL